MSKRDRSHSVWDARLIMWTLTKTGLMEERYWRNNRFGRKIMGFIFGCVELEPLRQ